MFVPFIAAYVSKSEQERFNSQVITKLGLLESQVHLVSMYEAIQMIPAERKMFEKQIPKIAQRLIPFWRGRLYAPRSKCLEQYSSSYTRL